MPILVTLPAIVSFLVLAAHFLHHGAPLLAAGCVGLCALLFSRNRWVIGLVQAILVLAAIEWLFTTYEIVQQRQTENREWMRAALILVGVAGFNVVSAILLRHGSRTRIYSHVQDSPLALESMNGERPTGNPLSQPPNALPGLARGMR